MTHLTSFFAKYLIVLSIFFASLSVQALPQFSPVEDIFVRAIQEHTTLKVGEKSHVGVEFKLPDGWHIYWKNPGDSGLPPIIILKGNHITTEALQYPVPTRFVAFGITGYGYKERTVLSLPFTINSSAENSTTALLSANFLMCKDICIPGSFETNLSWNIADKTQTDSNAISILNEFSKPKPLSTKIKLTVADSHYLVTAQGASVTGFLPDQNGMIDDTILPQYQDNSLLVAQDSWQGQVENLSGLIQLDNLEWHELPLTPIEGGIAKNTPEINTEMKGNTQKSEQDNTFLLLLMSAFLAGVILNLMPCVLPILALKVLAFTRPENKAHVAAYTLGTLTGFWLIASIIALFKEVGIQVGWGFHLQNSLFVASLSILMTLIAINLLSVFYIPVPKFFSRHRYMSGQGGAFSTGLLAVVLATPCTVPFMGGAVAYALTQDSISSFLLFSAMGAGLALPYIALAYIPISRRFLPAPGAWMETLKNVLAFPLFATALWLVWVFTNMTNINLGFTLLSFLLFVSLFFWLYGLSQRKGKACSFFWLLPIILLTIFLFPILKEKPSNSWHEWSPSSVENVLSQNAIAFVDVTADWCVTCKFTELTVLNRNDVQDLFKEYNVKSFRADWTNSDEKITMLLESFNRKGVPLYLMYFPDGRIELLSQLPTYGEIKRVLSSTE